MGRRQEVTRTPYLVSELPWAEDPLSRVASPEVQQKTGTGRGRDVSPLSPLHKTCRRFPPLETCDPGAVGKKSWKPLETQDTRILHWADLTQYWGVLGTVWGAGWAMGPAWVPCPKGVG